MIILLNLITLHILSSIFCETFKMFFQLYSALRFWIHNHIYWIIGRYWFFGSAIVKHCKQVKCLSIAKWLKKYIIQPDKLWNMCLGFFVNIWLHFYWRIIYYCKTHFQSVQNWVLINVYSHVTTITIKIWNISVTPESSLVPF